MAQIGLFVGHGSRGTVSEERSHCGAACSASPPRRELTMAPVATMEPSRPMRRTAPAPGWMAGGSMPSITATPGSNFKSTRVPWPGISRSRTTRRVNLKLAASLASTRTTSADSPGVDSSRQPPDFSIKNFALPSEAGTGSAASRPYRVSVKSDPPGLAAMRRQMDALHLSAKTSTPAQQAPQWSRTTKNQRVADKARETACFP